MHISRSIGSASVALALALGTATSSAAQPLSEPAQAVARWIGVSSDNARMPFLIIDKAAAQLWVFDAQGALLGSAPVLLGRAKGDDSVPGIGERPLASIRNHEKTTPAGRFVIEPGRNLQGEGIFWIDYDAAVSMHRVRAKDPTERRHERLASPTPADNRISFGCINVPAEFYDRVVQPVFARRPGVAYLLPETRSLQQSFGHRGYPGRTSTAHRR